MKTTEQLVSEFAKSMFPDLIVSSYEIKKGKLVIYGSIKYADNLGNQYQSGETEKVNLLDYMTWLFNKLSEKQ